jgi:hypothetical protein
MSEKINKSLFAAILQILRPLVRILLRNGVAYGTLAGLVRRVYVDVAYDEFAPEGRKQTATRVSALTGLTRKEVKRLLELEAEPETEGQARFSRGVRVVSGWMNDRQFHDSKGKPAHLPIEGARKSFTALVKKYSGDITVRAMLTMLEEGGTVSVKDDIVKLVRRAYVPGRDDVEKIAILGSDVSELIATIDHNLVAEPDELWFQRKVSYDNVAPESVEKLRKLSEKKAQALLELLDRQYSSMELDEDDARGKAVSFGIYFHEHDSSREQD